MSTRIFVTGLAGYLGRAIARDAAGRGYQVVGIDHVVWPEKEPLPPGVELIHSSLEEGAKFDAALQGCDALIHTAGLHLLNGKGQPMAEFIRINVELTAALIDQALNARIRRLALCSSMTVQAGIDLTANGMAVLDEEIPCRPDHPYSLSKVMVEELARSIVRRHGISAACLRFMGFGHDSVEAGGQLLARVLSVRDAARACLLAVEREGLRGEAFNIGSGTPLTNRHIADAQKDPIAVLERIFPGCTPVLQAIAFVPRTLDFWPACNNAKARAMLGYEPQDTFEAWLRAQGWERR